MAVINNQILQSFSNNIGTWCKHSHANTHTYIASVILSVIRAVSVNSVVQCKIHLLYNLHFVVVIRGFFVLLPKLNHMKKSICMS